MKTIADNRQSKKWISFGTLVLGAGTIYKLGCLKDAFYVPMQEFMGLSHTQIGTAMSVAGLISTFGFLISIYLTDRVSKKVMIPMSLIGIALLALSVNQLRPRRLCGHALLAHHVKDGPSFGFRRRTGPYVRYHGSRTGTCGYRHCLWRPGRLRTARKQCRQPEGCHPFLLSSPHGNRHHRLFPS